jgi:hypothetical protein
VINVHTSDSTGSGSFTSVVEAAQASHLDFIILTDLNNPEKKSLESYYDQLLVFIGDEYSYLDSRLLNFDATQNEELMGKGRAQMFFAELLSREKIDPPYGMFILAHPLKPGYRWRGEYPDGLGAMEVFNLKSIWQDSWLNDRKAFIANLLMYPFNPDLSLAKILTSSSRAEIALWDQLNQKRKVIGFAGSDAESRVKLFNKNFEIPSYKSLFSIMRNHVLLRSELTGNSTQDRRKIADALRAGQFYMCVDLVANPKGFSAYLKNKKGELTPLGASARMSEGLEYIVDLPAKPLVPFEVILYKDGEKIVTSTSARTSYAIHGPGSYRIALRLKVSLPPPGGRLWVPWIFTNPIQVQ